MRGAGEAARLVLPDHLGVVVLTKELLGRVVEGAQEDRRRHLAPPSDTNMKDVLGIELKVDPGASVGDHSSGIKELTGRVSLALVMIEEDTRRTVEL